MERKFDPKVGGWPMPWPSDMHTHYREGEMLWTVVPEAARHYRYATAMPNLGKNRIRTPEQAKEYRSVILRAGRKVNSHFDVNVPLYLEPDTDPKVVRQGFEDGAWIAAKLYPKGGTTQSAEGVDFNELERLDPVFGAMRELGMKLLIHAEPVFTRSGREIDVFDREPLALPYVEDLIRRHRGIKVVFEHVSSGRTVPILEQWARDGHTIGATVAPQYLVWSRNSLFRGGMNPVCYSIPVLKREQDREALCKFVVESGVPFLGTDSAPHPAGAKSRYEKCPGGVFSNPTALFTYFRVFKESGRADWFDRFVDFACFRGPHFYGLPVDERDAIAIVEDPWRVPETYGDGPFTVIPMHAGEEMKCRVKYL